MGGFNLPESKGYFATLGIQYDADPQQIKKVYKKAALKAHPDRNPNDPTAPERMQNLSNAYAVLSDPEAVSQYMMILRTRTYAQSLLRDSLAPGAKHLAHHLFVVIREDSFGSGGSIKGFLKSLTGDVGEKEHILRVDFVEKVVHEYKKDQLLKDIKFDDIKSVEEQADPDESEGQASNYEPPYTKCGTLKVEFKEGKGDPVIYHAQSPGHRRLLCTLLTAACTNDYSRITMDDEVMPEISIKKGMLSKKGASGMMAKRFILVGRGAMLMARTMETCTEVLNMISMHPHLEISQEGSNFTIDSFGRKFQLHAETEGEATEWVECIKEQAGLVDKEEQKKAEVSEGGAAESGEAAKGGGDADAKEEMELTDLDPEHDMKLAEYSSRFRALSLAAM